ncbi:SIR2 family protein [Clostridioides difficile]|nr:SIR2 family protein [Clostridioides difficile]
MKSLISDVINRFNATPFLFVGSGLTRRYYNLPNWEDLLKVFAEKISNDDFIYTSYKNKAKSENPKMGINPRIAELIENDFNKKWFSDSYIRSLDSKYLDIVKSGVSPFKAEIAMYIKNNSKIVDKYQDEVQKLSNISKKSLSGFITTNYDCFLETIVDNYTTYIGQENLVFSSIQGIAEIYKIHGCVSSPNSIVINEADYIDFDSKSAYLAAKLMTIFVEFPIIFIGYSVTDVNIKKILNAIVNCLSNENAKKLEERFIFIEYEKNFNDIEISSHTIAFDNKMITMTKIKLEDFNLLYDALSEKKSKLPVRILRMFKQEFYDFTITNKPTAKIRVGSVDDTRIKDEDLVLAVGKASDFGLKGLKGLSFDEWYRDIVMNDLEFSSDELLEYAYPSLIKQYNKLPLNKHLFNSTLEFPDYRTIALESDFENIISNSIKKNRNNTYIKNRSVYGIWNDEHQSFEKATRLIAFLEEKEIDTEQLENLLKKIFEENPNILESAKTSEKTNLRRLIRIYDYMKYSNMQKSLGYSE